MDMNFASKALGGTALGLSIGSGVLALNNASGGGLLGGLFGGGNCACSDNMAVNRYELNQQKEITNRDMEIAYLKGKSENEAAALELYKYVDGRFRTVESQLSAQAVLNAQITANISCMQNSIAAFNGLTQTVIPIAKVYPEPMPAYNSWTAPTATT